MYINFLICFLKQISRHIAMENQEELGKTEEQFTPAES
jgi:hypothetical protein